MAKVNPIKIALTLAALLLALALAAGLLYRAPLPDPDRSVNALAVTAGFLLVAFYASWAFRNFRAEQRRRWSLWQVAALTSLTGLAVQLSGGLSSFLLGFYLLLTWLAVLRAEPRWQLAPPLAAVAIELGSSYWGDRLYGEAVSAVFFLAMVGLSYAAGRLSSRKALVSAAAPAAGHDDGGADAAGGPAISLRQDLTALCALIQAAAGSRTSAVFQLEAMGGRLRLLAHRSYSPNVAPDAVIDVQRGFLGWVVRERQGLLYPSYDKDVRALGYYAKDEAVGSVLAVPVRAEDAVLGMLVVDSERDKAFTEDTKQLLAGFAELAGRMIALHQSHSALGIEKERLEEWNKRLELMASRLTTAEVIKAIKELVPTLVPCDHLALLQVGGDGRATVLLSDPAAVGFPIVGSTLDIAGTLAGQAAAAREWRLVDDFYRRSVTIGRYAATEKLDHGFRSVLAGPLLYEDQCHYVLVLESRQPHAFDLTQSAIHIIAGQFALALRSAAQYEEKEQMAVRDGLTGLANHRRFQEYLSETLQKADGQPVGIALFDIDHFKKLNDTYGHPVGDAVLKEVAARLRAAISQYDFVARYGGEEFVAVWPGRNDVEAAKLAEQVRQAIALKKFSTTAGELPVTISLGVAASPQDAAQKPDLIKAADEALYAAKHGGRNRVCRYSQSQSPNPPGP